MKKIIHLGINQMFWTHQ